MPTIAEIMEVAAYRTQLAHWPQQAVLKWSVLLWLNNLKSKSIKMVGGIA